VRADRRPLESDPSPTVRKEAATQLAEYGPDEAVVKALRERQAVDSDPEVRWEASEILIRYLGQPFPYGKVLWPRGPRTCAPTPVPGRVGPMTIAVLLDQTVHRRREPAKAVAAANDATGSPSRLAG
jgi:HEAT repeats/Tetrahydrofolate dehydrogenase/cyclohydrolase, NAD(P)-binding domain